MQIGCFNPCVDHNHVSGMVRGVISMEGNTFLGRVENSFRRFGSSSDATLPSILRSMADYLDKGDTNYLHPVGLKQLASRFNRLPVADQVFALKMLKAKINEIKACTNSKQRTLLYRKLITNNGK
jgi:phosphoribulokinase